MASVENPGKKGMGPQREGGAKRGWGREKKVGAHERNTKEARPVQAKRRKTALKHFAGERR